MDPQLSAVIGDLRAAEERVWTLQSTLSQDAWTRRPTSARWSPAECLAHLNLTSEALLPLVRAGLHEAGTGLRGRASTYRRDLVGWLVWKIVAPSGGVRTRTVRAFTPTVERSPDSLIAEFGRLQSEVISCVRAADGLPIDHVKLVSPFNACLRYNLYAALTMVPRHQHRHLQQAERAAGDAMPHASAIAV